VFQIRNLANSIQTKQYIKGECNHWRRLFSNKLCSCLSRRRQCRIVLYFKKWITWSSNSSYHWKEKYVASGMTFHLKYSQWNLFVKPDHAWMSAKLQRKMKYDGLVKPCDYFGETELIKNCKRHNTVVCLEHSQLLILNKADFFRCKSNKEIGF